MKPVVRWTLQGLGASCVLLALCAWGVWLWLESSLPQTQGRLVLPGLAQPVTVTRDADGIPTIRAESPSDAYTALGFVHAQDRLWQMDMTRRLGAGRLSEVYGEFTFRHDRFMRTLGIEQLVRTQFRALSPEARADLEAYSRGVNAFLDARQGALPPEFQLLRYAPAEWKPHHSLFWGKLMALQLSGNYRDELLRARLHLRLPSEKVAFLWPDHADDAPILDEARHKALRRLPEGQLESLAALLPWDLGPKSASNSWTLHGSRTRSGLPLLANDPHLALNAPGTWYLARLETPELALVGATAPGVPYHLIAHNGHVAWGFTTTHSDTQDLFIEKPAPGGEGYMTPQGPRPFATREESIVVRGEPQPRTLRVRTTRHGPVVSDALQGGEALAKAGGPALLALAWPALDPDDRTPDALRAMNRARNWPAFREATRRFHAPQQNIAYADRDGVHALIAPGKVPIRGQGDGRAPVPGWTGDYDWRGFVPFEELPRISQPASGHIVAANNRLVGNGYPHLLSAHWPPPARARRLESLLERHEGDFGVEDMTALQMDRHSRQAAQLWPVLLAHLPTPENGMEREARTLLEGWDYDMSHDAPAPLIHAAILRQLHLRLFADDLGSAIAAYPRPRPAVIRAALEADGDWCDDTGTDRRETCAEIVSQAFRSALQSLSAQYGGKARSWRWGAAHRAAFRHPVLDRVPLLGGLFDYGLATHGGPETVNRGGVPWFGPEPFQHRHGASLRVVFDLDDLDNSRFQIATGQSGNPLSETYGNFAERWRDGVFVKLVGDATEDSLRLTLNPR